MTIPPPPTTLSDLRYDEPGAFDRITTLWRLATTDGQRWELERLIDDVTSMSGRINGQWGDVL